MPDFGTKEFLKEMFTGVTFVYSSCPIIMKHFRKIFNVDSEEKVYEV